jgi:hypothetical protein
MADLLGHAVGTGVGPQPLGKHQDRRFHGIHPGIKLQWPKAKAVRPIRHIARVNRLIMMGSGIFW